MKYTSQHFCDKIVDLGGSDRLGFRGSDLHGFRGSDRLNRPSRIGPCFAAAADAHGFDVPRVQNCLLALSVKAHP